MATTATENLGLTQWPDFEMVVKGAAVRLASALTEPVCKAHELGRRIQLVPHLHPGAWKVEILARQLFLGLGLVLCAVFSPLALVGMGLRYAITLLQNKPYLYFRGNAASITKEEIVMLMWNIACNSAGHSISDAGVLPWAFRIDSIIAKIREKDPDLLVLQEVYDPPAAFYLYQQLQNEYAHFYFNIGPRAVGVSSGFFVASKLAIKNPNFVPFSKDILDGRTKNAEKGVFSFDVNGMRLFTTHLQHSEECAYPTQAELQCRKLEIEMLVAEVNNVAGPVIITGDLNAEGNELTELFKYCRESKTEKTWGGDRWYATFADPRKKISDPLTLDHTMASKGVELYTELVPTGYDATRFDPKALSDHTGLLSRIRVRAN